jgi:hypothetical protein
MLSETSTYPDSTSEVAYAEAEADANVFDRSNGSNCGSCWQSPLSLSEARDALPSQSSDAEGPEFAGWQPPLCL